MNSLKFKFFTQKIQIIKFIFFRTEPADDFNFISKYYSWTKIRFKIGRKSKYLKK